MSRDDEYEYLVCPLCLRVNDVCDCPTNDPADGVSMDLGRSEYFVDKMKHNDPAEVAARGLIPLITYNSDRGRGSDWIIDDIKNILITYKDTVYKPLTAKLAAAKEEIKRLRKPKNNMENFCCKCLRVKNERGVCISPDCTQKGSEKDGSDRID